MFTVSPFRLARAGRHLRNGGVVAYPTEGVFGLGCDPLNALAVQTLLQLKDRPMTKGMILIAADLDQIEPFMEIGGSEVRSRILATWPGPVTWVVPAPKWVPAWLRGVHSGVAVRVTAHPVAAALCRMFGGPIVSTSANRTGRCPARSVLSVRRYFTQHEVMLIPGRIGKSPGPTQIFDANSGKRLR